MKRGMLLAMGVLVVVGGVAGAASTQPATAPTSAPTTQPIRLLDAEMAQRFEKLGSLRDDPGEQREAARRRRLIRERLGAETDVSERIVLTLGWANWELAEAAAPAATRWLLGMRTRDDLERFGAAAEAAREALDAAKRDFEFLTDSPERAVQRQHRRWKQTLERLRTFADACAALAGSAPAGASDLEVAQEACRVAAIELAVLREDEDADTAAAARLWQALLLEAGGRADRALDTLDFALVAPDHLPYDFFLRLLRCSLLLDRGSYLLATALTYRVEAECDRWFGAGTPAGVRALAAVRVVRLKCLWRWADALRADEPELADRQLEKADALRAEHFPSDGLAPIYRLDRAVPIFVELPDLSSPAATRPTTSTAPAASAPSDEPVDPVEGVVPPTADIE
ncbi:MAG: hypothetical protein JXA69_18865 [Phycisphaerae bacterium]|nr:hypothetical protein [Phycisphaerae bacterium]